MQFLFGILGFLLLSNISFQIPIGITYFVLIFWRILEYQKDNKEQKENLKKIKKNSKEKTDKADLAKKSSFKYVLLIGILLVCVLGIIFYNYKPMKALEKKSGINYLMSYTYDIFKVFDKNMKYENSSCLSTFISVFPIGLIIGIVYIFKEETKHLRFIAPIIFVSILELIFLAANISISILPNYILILGFNLLQIYMILYFMARVEEKLFSLTKAAYVALAGLVIYMFMPIPTNLNKIILDLSYIVFVLEAYVVLNYADKRFWRLTSWVFTIICLFDFAGSFIVNFM